MESLFDLDLGINCRPSHVTKGTVIAPKLVFRLRVIQIRAILFLKSVSEKVGSDIQRLLI